MAKDTKMCQACRSTIDLLATKCRHCGDPTPLTELENLQIESQEIEASSSAFIWVMIIGFILYVCFVG